MVGEGFVDWKLSSGCGMRRCRGAKGLRTEGAAAGAAEMGATKLAYSGDRREGGAGRGF